MGFCCATNPSYRQRLIALMDGSVRAEYNTTEAPSRQRSNPMTQIILNDDQVQSVRQATDTVELCDQSGVPLGFVARKVMATPEEIAEALRRLASPGPWHTTEQFVARLRALEQ